MFLPLDILFEYWIEYVNFGLLYVMFRFCTRIFYRGVPGNWLSLQCLVPQIFFHITACTHPEELGILLSASHVNRSTVRCHFIAYSNSVTRIKHRPGFKLTKVNHIPLSQVVYGVSVASIGGTPHQPNYLWQLQFTVVTIICLLIPHSCQGTASRGLSEGLSIRAAHFSRQPLMLPLMNYN